MRRRSPKKSKVAVAAALAAVPMFATPGITYGQRAARMPAPATESAQSHLKFSDSFVKIKGDFSIAGVGDNHIIYQRPNGEYFYIDEQTGDIKQLPSDGPRKMTTADQGARAAKVDSFTWKMSFVKFDGAEGDSKVTLLGVDANGDIVNQRANGEKFTVNRKTGHITLMK
ncbi:MAG: hypothetical protein DYH20_07220 [Gammaproteobacteria bacterium PRO9]|nr:hypothetical protein [Gammaproteobacteria bacterium PRO9]